jgi:exodeoxyribonuclease VII small subunit
MSKKEITYQSAISEIEKILDSIENGEPDVDELTEKTKRVAALLKICKEKLHNTEKEVEKILGEIEG